MLLDVLNQIPIWFMGYIHQLETVLLRVEIWFLWQYSDNTKEGMNLIQNQAIKLVTG